MLTGYIVVAVVVGERIDDNGKGEKVVTSWYSECNILNNGLWR